MAYLLITHFLLICVHSPDVAEKVRLAGSVEEVYTTSAGFEAHERCDWREVLFLGWYVTGSASCLAFRPAHSLGSYYFVSY
jgi:hypothetical protein